MSADSHIAEDLRQPGAVNAEATVVAEMKQNKVARHGERNMNIKRGIALVLSFFARSGWMAAATLTRGLHLSADLVTRSWTILRFGSRECT
jgi:hypothetical protein